TAIEVQQFIDATGITFPMLQKGSGLLLPGSYFPYTRDTYFVIDANGTVRYIAQHNFDPVAIRAAVDANLPSPVDRATWAAVKGLLRCRSPAPGAADWRFLPASRSPWSAPSLRMRRGTALPARARTPIPRPQCLTP